MLISLVLRLRIASRLHMHIIDLALLGLNFIKRVAVFGLSSSKLKTTLISDLPAQREISQ